MDLSRITMRPPRITSQGQRNSEYRLSVGAVSNIHHIVPHSDESYWHPVTLPLPSSPHPPPITRIYFPSCRLQAHLATASDLPVDLFDLIISFIEVHVHERNFNGMVGFNKRSLGRVALVCRRWARTCQPKIFETITLRSRQDFIDLWSLIVCPESMVPRFIRYLGLDPANFDASAPWIHLVCQKVLSRSLHSDLSVMLDLKGQERTPLVLGRSIHVSLPRCLPVFSLGIRQLNLQYVHFRSLKDLARLTGEMPSLRDLYCNKVTWPPTSDEQPHHLSFVTRRSQWSLSYSMHDCTDSTAAVLLSLRIVPVGQPRLGIDDIHAMCCILRALPFSRNVTSVRSKYDFNKDTGSGGEPTVRISI